MDRQFDGKTAIVTGAARGMGLATAQRLVEEGANVLLVDADRAELDSVTSAMPSERVRTFVGDVADHRSVRAYMDMCADEFDVPDAVVLNAGIFGDLGPVEDYSVESFDRVMNVNVRGTWLGLRESLRAMRPVGRGSVVLMSSVQGMSARPFTSAYTTSKHAIVGMMRGAALEVAPTEIRVNAVLPGLVDTPLMAAVHETLSPDDPGVAMGDFSKGSPKQRYADPLEIASTILFLCGDGASFINGACMSVDGGSLAS